MLIFELLDQYEGICRRAFFGCSAKLNKTFKANIIELLILIMCIPRKINFLQLGRYGRRGEQRYRQTFRKDFDWMCFNMNLAADRFQYGMKRLAIAIDFAYNASLAAVNITKVLREQTKTPFSIGQIKSLTVNAHFIKRYFDLSGIDPYKTLNAKLVKELFGFAVDAA